MNAIIKTKNGFYCSTVFAYYSDKYNSSVIVFDESNLRLLNVKCDDVRFGVINLVVFIADNSEADWVENGKWSGLGFIVNDEALLNNINKGRDIAADILDKCKALQTAETFQGWNAIENDGDIAKLMNISVGFHDGYIENIEFDGNDVCVRFKCWSSRITVKFIGIIEYDEAKELSWGNNCIFDAVMRFENGNIKWYADGFCFWEYDDQACYFIARKAQYRIELD